MRTTTFMHVVTLASALCVPSQAGIVSFFTSRSAWETAVGSFTIETFNSVPTGTLAAGTTAVGSISFSHPGPIGLGSLPRIVEIGPVNGSRALTAAVGIDSPTFGNLPEYNNYILPGLATAFGANWESASSAGQLVIGVTGATINLPTHLPSPGTGFFGFISDTPFDTIAVTGLSTALTNPGEIYSIDNVSFNTYSPVPETGAYVVLSIGLVLIVAQRLARARMAGVGARTTPQ